LDGPLDIAINNVSLCSYSLLGYYYYYSHHATPTTSSSLRTISSLLRIVQQRSLLECGTLASLVQGLLRSLTPRFQGHCEGGLVHPYLTAASVELLIRGICQGSSISPHRVRRSTPYGCSRGVESLISLISIAATIQSNSPTRESNRTVNHPVHFTATKLERIKEPNTGSLLASLTLNRHQYSNCCRVIELLHPSLSSLEERDVTFDPTESKASNSILKPGFHYTYHYRLLPSSVAVAVTADTSIQQCSRVIPTVAKSKCYRVLESLNLTAEVSKKPTSSTKASKTPLSRIPLLVPVHLQARLPS